MNFKTFFIRNAPCGLYPFLGSLDATCEKLIGPIKRTIEIVLSSLNQ